ncbi:SRPBCC family protein [Faecalibacter rhinopitheci]|uniref:ATPase n=1 Tax=Faecalibacter rhinopitheci TaxID=2779678 RepID=A0A8J7KDH1_9FLAO|nr:ATPase [Faecalibacter rhinopitheci]MBF0597316.1 ATPase [Faecalibacter rhinopitheci]
MKIKAEASIQILRPIHDVFEAIINPDKMRTYFIESSSGPLEAYKTVIWKFPEFDDTFPVTGILIKPNEYISFDWSGGKDKMMVEIYLSKYGEDFTIINIIEHEFDDNKEGIERAIRQTAGWANFLSCMKASLEYGINLRTGAFDFMKDI